MEFDRMLQGLSDKLTGWLRDLILLLPNFFLAVLVVIVAWLLGRITRRIILRIMDRVTQHNQVSRLMATVGYLGVFVSGFFIALGILNLDKPLTSLLAGVGIVGLALGFAFQDIAANFISGIILALRHPFSEGEIVGTQDFTGSIKRINLRSTVMQTFQGQIVIIPNKDVFQNPIVNYSSLGHRRIDLSIGVSYGDDLEKVREIVLQTVPTVPNVELDRPVDMYFEEFGESSINFTVRFWVPFKRQPDYLSARSEAIILIKKAFDRGGITIPFPIRTLDFGIVGGKKLNEMWPELSIQRRAGDDGTGGENAAS